MRLNKETKPNRSQIIYMYWPNVDYLSYVLEIYFILLLDLMKSS